MTSCANVLCGTILNLCTRTGFANKISSSWARPRWPTKRRRIFAFVLVPGVLRPTAASVYIPPRRPALSCLATQALFSAAAPARVRNYRLARGRSSNRCDRVALCAASAGLRALAAVELARRGLDRDGCWPTKQAVAAARPAARARAQLAVCKTLARFLDLSKTHTN